MPFDPINGLYPQVPQYDDSGNIGTMPTVPPQIIAQAQSQPPPLQGGAQQINNIPQPMPMQEVPPPQAPTMIPAGLGLDLFPGGGRQSEYNQTGYWQPQTGFHQNILDPDAPEQQQARYQQNVRELGPELAEQARQLDAQRRLEKMATTPQEASPTSDGAFDPIKALVPKLAENAVKPTQPTETPAPTAADQIGNTVEPTGASAFQKDFAGLLKPKNDGDGPDSEGKNDVDAPALLPYPGTDGRTLSRESDLGRRKITQRQAPTPPAPPPQQEDYRGMTPREIMEQRYRDQMAAQDAGMNAAGMQLQKQAKGDALTNFLSRVVVPGANLFSKNPYMPGALGRVSAGMDAQVAAHVAARQKFAEMRMKQAEDAYKQLHETSVSDETARHNLAGENQNKDELAQRTKHEDRSDTETARNNKAKTEQDQAELKEKAREADQKLALEKKQAEQKFQTDKAARITDERNGVISRAKMKADIANLETKHQEHLDDIGVRQAENDRKAAEFMITESGKSEDRKLARQDKLDGREGAVQYDKKGNPMRKYVAPGQLPSEQVASQPKQPGPIESFIRQFTGGGQPATAAAPQQSAPATRENPGGIVRPPGVGPQVPPRALQFFHSLPPQQQAQGAQQFKQKYGIYPWEM